MPGAFTGMARRQWPRAGLAALAAVVLALAGGAALARPKLPPAEPPAAVAGIPQDLFGAGETAHPPATDFAKWTDTIARYEQERRQERALCEKGDCALQRWRDFLATLKGKDALAQLRAVNAYLNRVRYRTDLENYGVDDYWATPRELFARGGDCEDYALAKYLSLRALGWPAEHLRVAVVHDNARDLVHAALIAYHGGNAYLLDIEIADVTDHRNVARYAPIFAISEVGWWSYRPLLPVEVATAVAPVAKLASEKLALEWRSLHLRHKPGRPAKLAARPHSEERTLARSWPHLKHKPAQTIAKAIAAASPRPAPRAPVVAVAPAHEWSPAREPAVVAEPGERIEEMFLPGAK